MTDGAVNASRLSEGRFSEGMERLEPTVGIGRFCSGMERLDADRDHTVGRFSVGMEKVANRQRRTGSYYSGPAAASETDARRRLRDSRVATTQPRVLVEEAEPTV